MGKNFLYHLSIVLGLVFILCSSCQLETKREELKGEEEEKASESLVAEEHSLKADREKFAEMRKAIPQDKRQSNDELALVLADMAGEKKAPSQIRQKWSRLVRKRRQKFDKEMRADRKAFNKKEKKSRDTFLDDQKKKRREFTSNRKVSRSERTEFYREQDAKRREYFANERERRSEYESKMRQKRKDFNDYNRERRKTFQAEMRDYSKRYMTRRREEGKAKRMKQKENRMLRKNQFNKHPKHGGIIQKTYSAEDQAIIDEIEQAKQLPGQPLGSGQ